MGTSRSTGRSTIVSAMSAYTANGASLFSRTRITFVLVVPPTVISSTSLSARMNCGECGSDPVMGGSPKKENPSVTSDITKKFRWYAGPLARLFSGLFASREEMFISTYISNARSAPGPAAHRGSQLGPAPRSTTHEPRPSAGIIDEGIVSISNPSTPLPHATSVPTVMAAAMPKSAVISRMNRNKNGDVRTASAHRPSCRVSSARSRDKSAWARSYSSDVK